MESVRTLEKIYELESEIRSASFIIAVVPSSAVIFVPLGSVYLPLESFEDRVARTFDTTIVSDAAAAPYPIQVSFFPQRRYAPSITPMLAI